MATFYEPDSSGGFKVTLPNGTRVPMMLSEEKLRQAGAMPVMDEGPDMRTALAGRGAQSGVRPPGPEAVSDAVTEMPGLAGRNQQPAAPAPAPAPAEPSVNKAVTQADDVVIAKPPPKATGQAGGVNPYQMTPEQANDLVRRAMQPRRVTGRPAKDVLQQRVIKTDGAPTPEAVQGIADSYGQLDKAYRAQETADLAMANYQTAQANLMAEQKLQASQELQRQRQEIDAEVRRRMSEVAARSEEIRSAPAPRSTNLFENTGALGRIGGALAVFMGSLGRQMSGGSENMAIKAIEEGIDRDIATQQNRLAKMGGDLDNAKGALAEYTRLHGSPELGAKELKAAQLEYAMAKGDAMAERARSQQVTASWQVKRAELEAMKQRELAELEGRMQGTIQETYAHQEARAGGYVTPSLSEATKALEQRTKLAGAFADATGTQKPDPNTAIYMAGGTHIGYAKSEEEAKELRSKVIPFAESMDQTYNDLIHMAKSWSKADAAQRARMVSSHVFAEMETKGESGFGMGALTSDEKATLDSAVRNPAEFLSRASANIAGLEQTRDNFRRKTTLRVQGQGIPVSVLPWRENTRAD